MSFENRFENKESEPVARLTLDEFEEIRSVTREQAQSPEFKQRLEDLGVPLNADEEFVLIWVEGHPIRMTTRWDDFGTLSMDEETARSSEALGLGSGVSAEVEAWLGPVDENLVREIEAEEQADKVREDIFNGIKKRFGFGKQ